MTSLDPSVAALKDHNTLCHSRWSITFAAATERLLSKFFWQAFPPLLMFHRFSLVLKFMEHFGHLIYFGLEME